MRTCLQFKVIFYFNSLQSFAHTEDLIEWVVPMLIFVSNAQLIQCLFFLYCHIIACCYNCLVLLFDTISWNFGSSFHLASHNFCAQNHIWNFYLHTQLYLMDVLAKWRHQRHDTCYTVSLLGNFNFGMKDDALLKIRWRWMPEEVESVYTVCELNVFVLKMSWNTFQLMSKWQWHVNPPQKKATQSQATQ